MNKDVLITAFTKNKKFNAYITLLSNTSREAQNRHKMNIISSSIFSRAMVSSVLLSGNLKNSNDILTLKWNCTGPIKTILVEVNYEGKLRGFVGDVNLPVIEQSIQEGLIKTESYIEFGELLVSRKTFNNRSPYVSISNLETGEIAQDVAIFIKKSLQIESALKIGFSVTKENKIEACGGILFMAMPDALDDDIKDLHNSFESISSLTNLLKEKADNNTIEYLADTFKLDILTTKNIKFECSCNKEKIGLLLKSLKTEDFTSFITDKGDIEVGCEYCGALYIFKPDEVRKIK